MRLVRGAIAFCFLAGLGRRSFNRCDVRLGLRQYLGDGGIPPLITDEEDELLSTPREPLLSLDRDREWQLVDVLLVHPTLEHGRRLQFGPHHDRTSTDRKWKNVAGLAD